MAGATDGLAMGYPPFLHSIPQAGGERRSMPMICGMPWPMMVMIVSSGSRPGNDIQASTKRCTAIELLEDLGVLVKETNTFQYRHEGKERFRIMGEQVHAFVPAPLPPADPPLAMRGPTVELHAGAVAALSRLAVAGMMVPSTDWFLYGFVRNEAVITSLENGLHCGLLLLEHPGRAAMLADGDTRALEHRTVGGEVALDDQDAAGGFERAVDGVDDVLVGELHLHVLEANTALHILLHTFAIAGYIMGVIPSHDPLTAPIPAEVPLPNAPLLRVIAQIRFPQVLSIEKREFVAPFQEALRSQYPVLRNELSQAVMFGPQGASPAAPQTIWRFADVESNWRVSLAPDFAAIETTAYESRKDFLKRFEAVVHALGEHVSPRVLDRVGVRYIDRVTGDAFDAIENLVRPEVLGVAATALGAHAVHAISESVFAISQTSAQLLARWGLLPKGATVDPAAIDPLDQPSWILDLDMYRSGQREYDAAEVVQEANGFAERIYAVFRWAVTDDFLGRYGGQV